MSVNVERSCEHSRLFTKLSSIHPRPPLFGLDHLRYTLHGLVRHGNSLKAVCTEIEADQARPPRFLLWALVSLDYRDVWCDSAAGGLRLSTLRLRILDASRIPISACFSNVDRDCRYLVLLPQTVCQNLVLQKEF